MTKKINIDQNAMDEIHARINDHFYDTQQDLRDAGCDHPAVVAAALYSATATYVGYDDTQDMESRLNSLRAQRDHIDECIKEIANTKGTARESEKVLYLENFINPPFSKKPN